jgi:hypothetical protein
MDRSMEWVLQIWYRSYTWWSLGKDRTCWLLQLLQSIYHSYTFCAEQGQDESVLLKKGKFFTKISNIVFDIHAYEKWLLIVKQQ